MPDEITTASTASIKTIKNLKTDQIIYPVTKANAVYLNSTVEGEGETPVLQTVQGKLNDTRDDLDFWIRNKVTNPQTQYSQEYNSDGYYVRIGVDRVGTAFIPPFAYMDILDLGTATEDNPYGNLVSNIVLASNVDASKRHNNAFLTNRDIRCTFYGTNSDNYASLRQMVGRAVDTGLPALSSIEQLDNLKNNVIYYAPGNGVQLGLPFSYAMIWQYCASGTYKIQFAAQYNSNGWIISRSKGLNSDNTTTSWNSWKTVHHQKIYIGSNESPKIVPVNNTTTTSSTLCLKNGIGILHVNVSCPAKTYANSTTGAFLRITEGKPPHLVRSTMFLGSSAINMKLDTNGYLYSNNTITTTASSYLLGQIVYSYE